jgi:hypothetical protein
MSYKNKFFSAERTELWDYNTMSAYEVTFDVDVPQMNVKAGDYYPCVGVITELVENKAIITCYSDNTMKEALETYSFDLI